MSEVNKNKKLEPDIRTINEIIDNYVEMESSQVSQLLFKFKPHGTTIGGFREDIWSELFTQIVPKKFVVEQSVFIIDSKGHVSPEVDLAILDEMYTPYIFRKGRLKFIPIEAVAVAIECKSLSATYGSLDKWTTTIKNMETSRESIARINGNIATGDMDGRPQTQTSTRPILIYCCLGNAHSTNMNLFDFTLQVDLESKKIKIHRNEGIDKLREWYYALNHNDTTVDESLKHDPKSKLDASIDDYQVKRIINNEETEVSLLSFTFQLNQLLMLINNPMWFPHKAYVDLFNKTNS